MVGNVPFEELEPPVVTEKGRVTHRIFRQREGQLSGDMLSHHVFSERGCTIERLGGCKGKTFRKNGKVSSGMEMVNLGIGLVVTGVGRTTILVCNDSLLQAVRRLAARAEEKQFGLERKTGDQGSERLERQSRMFTQVVLLNEVGNKIGGQRHQGDVLSDVRRNICRGTDDVVAGVADGDLEAGVDAEVVMQELDFANFDDCMRPARLVAVQRRVDLIRQRFIGTLRC